MALDRQRSPTAPNAGPRSSWTAVALPGAGTGVVALVNRESGRCLGTDPGSDTSVVASECAWGAASRHPAVDGRAPRARSHRRDARQPGQRARPQGQRHRHLTTAPVNGDAGERSIVAGVLRPRSRSARAPARRRGDDVPSYSFSANPLTYTMAAGDLDRVSESGDTYMYHDEAVMAWMPNGDTPSQQTRRPCGWSTTSPTVGCARCLTDLSTGPFRLPAMFERRTAQTVHCPGSLGLAVGDFDGDSLNEIAYISQDESGMFRVTMLKYRRHRRRDPLAAGGGARRRDPGVLRRQRRADAASRGRDGRDHGGRLRRRRPRRPGHRLCSAVHRRCSMSSRTPTWESSASPRISVCGEQQYTALTSRDLNVVRRDCNQQRAQGLRVAPGLFRVDPDVGYTMERRQLAVAWTDTSDFSTFDTKVAVYSVDPDADTCTQATCDLAVNTLAAPKQVRCRTDRLGGLRPAAVVRRRGPTRARRGRHPADLGDGADGELRRRGPATERPTATCTCWR